MEDKSEAEWKKILSKEEFYVLRQKGTEFAGTGRYLYNKEKGIYICAGCGVKLFSSETKYHSGSGWPSFYDKIGNIKEIRDTSFRMQRIEIQCANCGGHLGHVFDDGPDPTGIRFCVNGTSLKFKEDK